MRYGRVINISHLEDATNLKLCFSKSSNSFLNDKHIHFMFFILYFRHISSLIDKIFILKPTFGNYKSTTGTYHRYKIYFVK